MPTFSEVDQFVTSTGVVKETTDIGTGGTGGTKITVGPTPPTNPQEGDLWVDTTL